MSYESPDLEVARAFRVLARTGELERYLGIELPPQPGDMVVFYRGGWNSIWTFSGPGEGAIYRDSGPWSALLRDAHPALVLSLEDDGHAHLLPAGSIGYNRCPCWDDPEVDHTRFSFWAPARWRPTEEWLKAIMEVAPRSPVPPVHDAPSSVSLRHLLDEITASEFAERLGFASGQATHGRATHGAMGTPLNEVTDEELDEQARAAARRLGRDEPETKEES